MKDLTIQQKAAAFDTLVEWLKSESESERKLSDENWAENRNILASWNNGKADAYSRAREMALQIAAQRSATTEQAENMPPAGCKLEAGMKVKLWNSKECVIQENGHFAESLQYKFIALWHNCRYSLTDDGFFGVEKCPSLHNIKTILP